MEFTLLAAALTGFAFAWLAIRLLWRRMVRIDRPLDTLIGAAALGMIGGRLVAMVADGVNPVTHPLDILIVRAGVNTVAASALTVGSLFWTGRRQLPSFVDAVAPAALAGLGGWQAGCLWRGTCLGAAADVPWGWAQPGSDVTRHPIGIYLAVALIGGAWVVARTSKPWVPTGLAIAMAGLSRLLIEPLRPSLTGGPVWWYTLAVLAGTTAAIAGTAKRSSPTRSDPDSDRSS